MAKVPIGYTTAILQKVYGGAGPKFCRFKFCYAHPLWNLQNLGPVPSYRLYDSLDRDMRSNRGFERGPDEPPLPKPDNLSYDSRSPKSLTYDTVLYPHSFTHLLGIQVELANH